MSDGTQIITSAREFVISNSFVSCEAVYKHRLKPTRPVLLTIPGPCASNDSFDKLLTKPSAVFATCAGNESENSSLSSSEKRFVSVKEYCHKNTLIHCCVRKMSAR